MTTGAMRKDVIAAMSGQTTLATLSRAAETDSNLREYLDAFYCHRHQLIIRRIVPIGIDLEVQEAVADIRSRQRSSCFVLCV